MLPPAVCRDSCASACCEHTDRKHHAPRPPPPAPSYPASCPRGRTGRGSDPARRRGGSPPQSTAASTERTGAWSGPSHRAPAGCMAGEGGRVRRRAGSEAGGVASSPRRAAAHTNPSPALSPSPLAWHALTHPVQGVEHGHVGGQRLLGDHVAHLQGRRRGGGVNGTCLPSAAVAGSNASCHACSWCLLSALPHNNNTPPPTAHQAHTHCPRTRHTNSSSGSSAARSRSSVICSGRQGWSGGWQVNRWSPRSHGRACPHDNEARAVLLTSCPSDLARMCSLPEAPVTRHSPLRLRVFTQSPLPPNLNLPPPTPLPRTSW